MVKLLQWRQWGSVNLIYGMVEVESWPITTRRNLQYLIGEKTYSLAYIIRGAYVIPATLLLVQY